MSSRDKGRGGVYDLDPRRLELLLRLSEADRSRRPDPPARAPEPGAPTVLSYAQERIWLAEQLDPGNSAYTISLPLRIIGPLDHTALSAALDRIVERHDALRTTVEQAAGRPVGRLGPPQSDVLRVADLRHLEPEEREAKVRDLMTRHLTVPFNLATGPLYRMNLVRTGDAEHLLLLDVHHIAADNFSLRIFCRELEMFYAAPDPDAVTVARPLSYARFAARQRASLDAELGTLERYWKDQLDGMPSRLHLPLDHPRTGARSFRGARKPFAMPAKCAAGFADLLARHAVTPFIATMVGLFVVLQRWCGQDDIVVGTDVANRNSAELEQAIGFFANQLVIRMRLDDNPTVAEALRRMKKVCLDAYRHQNLPFQHVVGLIGKNRDGSQPPLFQVKLGFLRYGIDELHLDGLDVTALPTEGSAKFELEVTCWSTPDGTVDGTFEYATDLFDGGTIHKLSEYLAFAVSGMCEDDTQRVLDIPLGTGSPSANSPTPLDKFAFE